MEFDERIYEIRRKDPRYAAAAYPFVFEALAHTLQILGHDPRVRRHISGRDLLRGVRDLGLRRFGLMARVVFNSWGVTTTEDFGNIVFNLVDSGVMGKTDQDSIADFQDVYDLADLDLAWTLPPEAMAIAPGPTVGKVGIGGG